MMVEVFITFLVTSLAWCLFMVSKLDDKDRYIGKLERGIELHLKQRGWAEDPWRGLRRLWHNPVDDTHWEFLDAIHIELYRNKGNQGDKTNDTTI